MVAGQDVKHRILVVDDDRDTVDGLAILLRHFGYEARAAYSGSEAIAVVDTFDPHVVMLDIAMPDISGYEVARLIREREPGRYIIAATGYAMAADRHRAISEGFDAHLAKPMTSEQLLDAIRQSVASIDSADAPHLRRS